jgi:hypothetical protein
MAGTFALRPLVARTAIYVTTNKPKLLPQSVESSGGRDPAARGFFAQKDRSWAECTRHPDTPRQSVVGHAGEAGAGAIVSWPAFARLKLSGSCCLWVLVEANAGQHDVVALGQGRTGLSLCCSFAN